MKELDCEWIVDDFNCVNSYTIAIKPEEIQVHMKELLSQVHMRILVTGNIYKDVRQCRGSNEYVYQDTSQEAIKIANMAEDGLGVSPLSPIELNDSALILPEGILNYLDRFRLLILVDKPRITRGRYPFRIRIRPTHH